MSAQPRSKSLPGRQDLADCVNFLKEGEKEMELEISVPVLLAYGTRMGFGEKLMHRRYSRGLGVMV